MTHHTPVADMFYGCISTARADINNFVSTLFLSAFLFFFFFYMKGYDNTGLCGRLGGCKVVGPGRSDYIYWSEIRGKCVLAGLYGAACDWFSLARGRR